MGKKDQPKRERGEFQGQNDGETVEDYAERVVAVAQEEFSLSEMVAKQTRRHRTIPLFFDVQAIDRYKAAQISRDSLRLQAENKHLTDENHRKALLDEADEWDEKMEQYRDEMLGASVSIHLVSLLDEEITAFTPGVRRKFTVKGNIPQDQLDAFLRELSKVTLTHMAERMTKPSGETVRPLRYEHAHELFTSLPPSQLRTLRDAMDALNFEDDIAQAGITEPGF